MPGSFTYHRPLQSTSTVKQTQPSTNAQPKWMEAPTKDGNVATTPRTIPEKPTEDQEHPLHRTSIESHPWINVNETQPLSLQERAQQPTHKITEGACSIPAPTSEIFWVDAGANGDATSETHPAGNITYVLRNKVTSNDTIKVKPGVYNTTIGETFPLNFTRHGNITLKSTGGPANTILHGTNTHSGIDMHTGGNTINGFTLSNFADEQNEAAVYVHWFSSRNTITCNTIHNADTGIFLNGLGFRYHTIVGNTITDNTRGIYLDFSFNNTILNNTLANNRDGIVLKDSGSNIIYGNVMEQCGMSFLGVRATFTSQLISENNTVNGKPVYYYANQDMEGVSVPSDAGQVILGNVTGLTIENFNVSNGSVGIILGYSSHIIITDTSFTDNTGVGIYLRDTTNIKVTRNTLSNNDAGIHLEGSNDTTVTSNTITGNIRGIHLDASSENMITGNNVTNNSYGLSIQGRSTDNLVYRNNFRGNGENAMDLYGGNAFNTSTIGNYWDDYTGSDADGDGIGDTPYVISGSGGSKDYLPSMEPISEEWEEENGGSERLIVLIVGVGIGVTVFVIAIALYIYKKGE